MKYLLQLLILICSSFPGLSQTDWVKQKTENDLMLDSEVKHIQNVSQNNKTEISNQDTIIFDFSESTCIGNSMKVPVRFNSDETIYAVDFALKFAPTDFSYISVINHKPYLSYSANYNINDSTLRFSSYSNQPMENNSNLVSIVFNLPASQIQFTQIDSVYTLLNGDNCNSKFVEYNPPTIIHPGTITSILPGDSVTLSFQPNPGCSYLWSTGTSDTLIIVNTAGLYSLTTLYPNGCTSISDILVSFLTPLPVELISFKAKQQQNTVKLEWISASESDNDYYSVEKSSDANQWLLMDNLHSSPNPVFPVSYTITDKNPSKGHNIYRLKQTDLNGHSSILGYSEVLFYDTPFENANITIYPNPVNPESEAITIKVTCIEPLNILTIYDATGRIVASHTNVSVDNSGSLSIGELSINEPQFTPGLYFVQFQCGTTMLNDKFIVK